LFKKFSAELGDPKNLFVEAKLSKPTSLGVLTKMRNIKIISNNIQNIFNIISLTSKINHKLQKFL